MGLPRRDPDNIVAEAEARRTDRRENRRTAKPRYETMRAQPSLEKPAELPAGTTLVHLPQKADTPSVSQVLHPNRRNRLTIIATILSATGALSIVVMGAYSDIAALYRLSPAAGAGLTVAWICLLGPIAAWVAICVARFRGQCNTNRIRDHFAHAGDGQNAELLKEKLKQYFDDRYARRRLTREEKERCECWLRQQNFWKNGDGIRASFRSLDEVARTRVSTIAVATAISTAVSQRAWVDVMLVVGKGFYLVMEVAEVYGMRPGRIGSMRLFFRSVRNGLLSGVFQRVGDTGGSAVANFLGGMPFVGRGFSMAAQGMLNGSIMLRLGYGCIQECRPLPNSEMEIRESLCSLMSALRTEVKNAVARVFPSKGRSKDGVLAEPGTESATGALGLRPAT